MVLLANRMQSEIQVEKKHYYSKDYNHKARWLTYFYQMQLLLKWECKEVLEIGPGHSWMKHIIADLGVQVKTVDFDPALDPDFVGDIAALPVPDKSYDCVCAFEVLEHLPFEQFATNLTEMARASRQYVIFSVPDHRHMLFHIRFKVPFLKYKELMIKIPTFTEHKFDGQHYWEIGKRGNGVDDVKKEIAKTDLELVESFVYPDAAMNHYFVLKKRA